MLEFKINELEKKLANVKLVDETQIDISKVGILSNVTIKNKKTGKELSYRLVSEAEADIKTNRISISSPIGQGLSGKVIGDICLLYTSRCV